MRWKPRSQKLSPEDAIVILVLAAIQHEQRELAAGYPTGVLEHTDSVSHEMIVGVFDWIVVRNPNTADLRAANMVSSDVLPVAGGDGSSKRLVDITS